MAGPISGLAPTQDTFDETLQRWRAVGITVPDLTEPVIEPRSSHTDGNVFNYCAYVPLCRSKCRSLQSFFVLSVLEVSKHTLRTARLPYYAACNSFTCWQCPSSRLGAFSFRVGFLNNYNMCKSTFVHNLHLLQFL